VGRAHAEVFALRQQSHCWLQQQSDARKESSDEGDKAELDELADEFCTAAW
jgi:hypothetical protein